MLCKVVRNGGGGAAGGGISAELPVQPRVVTRKLVYPEYRPLGSRSAPQPPNPVWTRPSSCHHWELPGHSRHCSVRANRPGTLSSSEFSLNPSVVLGTFHPSIPSGELRPFCWYPAISHLTRRTHDHHHNNSNGNDTATPSSGHPHSPDADNETWPSA